MFTSEFTTDNSSPSSSSGTLRLVGTATIEFCAELRDTLLDGLSKTQILVIDVGQITAIDVAGLQLLCAAHRSALLNYKCVSLGPDRSDAFISQTRDAGYLCTMPGTCLRTEGQTCLWTDPASAMNCEAL